ncbi:COX15 Cytochrome c oxidase assembly protein COX15 [Candida maltosa Xu316]|uniref:Cytochrome c oxidase assembly protein COX15 n=1 Tax=Candida maltosa (strain Xu316) TaxID=1245528 RepID=M3IHD3_CANMX|nr:Cytochrome c oxidase assembly protein COX15 [Candida maltosa Xu316]
MLSKTRFFFSKNSLVLNTLQQNKGCKLSIACRARPTSKFLIPQLKVPRIFNNVIKRKYTTVAQQTKESTITKPEFIKPKTPPVVPSSSIAWWLLGTSGLVFGIVVLGGLTRLTESGLSITEWKPVTGAIPPLNEQEWQDEFDKYKDSPEFKQLNSHITLEEFKFIFSMEWGHRLVGRCIGAFFIVPAIYFWASGRFNPRITRRVVGLTALLGLQGAIGWWMVKSGLDEEQLAERKSKPTVSQYRLTTHLGAAFLMYLGVLWTAFEILNENKLIKTSKKTPQIVQTILNQLNNPALRTTKAIGLGLLVLTFITAMSGGMVAGLDAGLIYNTFPHMGDDWVPSQGELMDPVYARKEDKSDLWWRNILENPTTVQLVHRIFATTTFFSILGAHIYVNRHKHIIPLAAKRIMHAVMGVATLQVSLGIFTLLYLVPIPLAAMHQAGALALLTASLAFSAKVKKPRPQFMQYINSSMKNQLLKSRI